MEYLLYRLRQRQSHSFLPQHTAYLAAALRKAGHEVYDMAGGCSSLADGALDENHPV